MCFAIVALAMDLIWGYTGILSLGHGLFFALGGYAFGMYLMRQIGRDGVYGVDLPDFMVFLDWKELPWYWVGSNSFLWAALLVVAVPGLLAFVFGFFAFRSRIKGVYFSIITQALTFAAMLAFFRNDMGFGGNNGFTDFKRILGFPITAPETRTALYVLSAWRCSARCAGALDRAEQARPRADRNPRPGIALMFLGYRTLYFALRLDAGAMLSGIAALYVPQVGIINERDEPSQLDRDRDLGALGAAARCSGRSSVRSRSMARRAGSRSRFRSSGCISSDCCSCCRHSSCPAG
jgi:urea transport system permease protein